MSGFEEDNEAYPPLPERIIIPDELDYSFERKLQTDQYTEALENLDYQIGRIAVIAFDTWPKSLFTLLSSDGYTMIRTKEVLAGRKGRCLNMTINHATTLDTYSQQMDIYDYMVSLGARAISLTKSKSFRRIKIGLWEQDDYCGPVIYNRGKTYDVAGSKYKLPEVNKIRINKKSLIEIIEETNSAETLIEWLQIANASTYDDIGSSNI